MKIFKRVVIAMAAIYLLSVTACRKDRVEVIPGGANPVGAAEDELNEDYMINGIAGFRFSFITRVF